MTELDLSRVEELEQLLPDLSASLRNCAALFSCGYRPSEIAKLRGTTPKTVKAQLEEVKKYLDLDSYHHIRNIVLIRILSRSLP